MSGKLIVLEGIDNAGKTTQISKLSDLLTSRRVPHIISRELTTPIGHLIQSYFGTASFTPVLKTLLFAADRMQRFEQEITPALKSNMLVLADRWVLSAIVYRMVEGLDQQFVLQVNSLAGSPDITILIDIRPEEAYRRGLIDDKLCPYSLIFLRKTQQIYLELAEQHQIPIVDGMKSPNQVLRTIVQKISSKLGRSPWNC